jgi:alginate O-acetyltransferase complex protein AlgI
MLFHSLDFLVFYTVVVVLYFAWPAPSTGSGQAPSVRDKSRGSEQAPSGPDAGRRMWDRIADRVGRCRWVLLLVASYYFYAAWAPEYLLWIVVSTLIDYIAAIQIAKTTADAARKGLLALSIVANLGLLFVTKYLGFFGDSLQVLLNPLNVPYDVPVFRVLLPVGISFYTLQTIGYTVDVYRGKVEPERHLGLFALFVSFFPQLVAGPIERAGNLLPQFRARRELSASGVVDGLRLMLWGMFKKVVIADRLALYVNGVYDHPADYRGLPILLATLFFAVQIYCDFSGYSDIALGAAKVMGYDLTQNFRQPYFATSIAEFWRRWHISLSSWFRDYVYIPLGGNRVAKWRWYANLMVVFVASGLWHGASWTFVLWGALHGLYYLVEVWTTEIRDKALSSGARLLRLKEKPVLGAVIGGLVTFILVCFAWVFFRANSISDAFTLIGGLVRSGASTALAPLAGEAGLPPVVAPWGGAVSHPSLELAFAFVLIALLAFVDRIQADVASTDEASGGQRLAWMRGLDPTRNVWIRWAVYMLLALAIMNLGVSQGTPFVYLQF